MNTKNFKDALAVCKTLQTEELLYLNKKIYTDEPYDLKNYYEWVTAISIELIRKDKIYSKICYN